MCNVVGVVTSPDKLTGRHQILTPSPVAIVAAKHDLPVFKPEKLDSANLAHLKLLKPDYFLVVSYGKIIPNEWLGAAKTLNIHFSLLPKYRGALCIQEALKNGDVETGVTLMEMVEKLDAGPIISKRKVKIDLSDNIQSLTTKLTTEAITSITIDMQEYFNGNIKPIPQNEQQVILTPTTRSLTRTSAFIPWSDLKLALSGQHSALKLHNLIRSLNPNPGAWTRIPVSSGQGQVSSEIEVKIVKTSLDTRYLILDTIQLPGKSPISWSSFLSGHPEVSLT